MDTLVIEFVFPRHYLTSNGVAELIETFKFNGGYLGDQGRNSIMGCGETFPISIQGGPSGRGKPPVDLYL